MHRTKWDGTMPRSGNDTKLLSEIQPIMWVVIRLKYCPKLGEDLTGHPQFLIRLSRHGRRYRLMRIELDEAKPEFWQLFLQGRNGNLKQAMVAAPPDTLYPSYLRRRRGESINLVSA